MLNFHVLYTDSSNLVCRHLFLPPIYIHHVLQLLLLLCVCVISSFSLFCFYKKSASSNIKSSILNGNLTMITKKAISSYKKLHPKMCKGQICFFLLMENQMFNLGWKCADNSEINQVDHVLESENHTEISY